MDVLAVAIIMLKDEMQKSHPVRSVRNARRRGNGEKNKLYTPMMDVIQVYVE